ncbi:MAG: hypothetical protein U0746_08040 [Gemmataceae bacterium]
MTRRLALPLVDLLTLAGIASAVRPKPDVVVIVADDFGYAEFAQCLFVLGLTVPHRAMRVYNRLTNA